MAGVHHHPVDGLARVSFNSGLSLGASRPEAEGSPMRKDIFRLAGIAAILIAALVLAASFYLRAQRVDRAERIAESSRADDSIFVRPHSRRMGPQDAKVTVVEFVDPECETCREM